MRNIVLFSPTWARMGLVGSRSNRVQVAPRPKVHHPLAMATSQMHERQRVPVPGTGSAESYGVWKFLQSRMFATQEPPVEARKGLRSVVFTAIASTFLCRTSTVSAAGRKWWFSGGLKFRSLLAVFFRFLPRFIPKPFFLLHSLPDRALMRRKTHRSRSEAPPGAGVMPTFFGNFKPPLFHQFHAAAHTPRSTGSIFTFWPMSSMICGFGIVLGPGSPRPSACRRLPEAILSTSNVIRSAKRSWSRSSRRRPSSESC